jgi:hypothetical protein
MLGVVSPGHGCYRTAYGSSVDVRPSTETDPGHGLEKAVWTDADFDVMGWHDCKAYALALIQDDENDFAGRLFLDLDYIVAWAGGEKGAPFSFWITPATLIFHSVCELEGSISHENHYPQAFEIDSIEREPVDTQLGHDRWSLISDLDIAFRAAGFRQILRREPIHVPAQHLTMESRGGISFSEIPYDASPSALSTTHASNPPPVHRIVDDKKEHLP